MRIAFISLGFSPYRGSGLDMSGERLITALLKEGQQITLIAGNKEDQHETLHHPNLKIIRVPLDSFDWLSFGYRAAKILNQQKDIDRIHFWDVHFGWAYLGDFIASVQHSFRQRLISLERSPERINLAWLYRKLYYYLARRIFELPSLNRSRGLLAGSSTTRDEYINNYMINPEKIVVVPHGIDVNYYSPSSQTERLRQRLGIIPGEKVIMFAGFMTPRKGIEYLYQALSMMHPKPKLLLIGRWRNESYRRYVYEFLEPIKSHVLELGFVPDDQMVDYYSLADVYVSSSLMEGFGIPIAEALACQTPVVAVDAGSVSEVMGSNGTLVPPRDPQSMADAVSKLLVDNKLSKELGRSGREHVVKNFDINIMTQKTLEAYERYG
jgi:glycosyltransferase involved in cell wall biosynthesis